jgi:chemotaxis protein methyltransferase CheR
MLTGLAGAELDLQTADFHKLRGWIHQHAGIRLPDEKRELLKSRLGKRLRALNLEGFHAYVEYLTKDDSGIELKCMLDAIAINVSYFFREEDHFDFLAGRILKTPSAKSRLRIWSAGCASGEEPYSLAIKILETLPDAGLRDIRILATDISHQALYRAQQGGYAWGAVKTVPAPLLEKYFDRAEGEEPVFWVRAEVRRMVSFARLSLVDPWPMHGPFEVIFCRNVMIYFDAETRRNLIRRFTELLAPGGTLIIGHTESLTGMEHGLKYTIPTVYQKG